MKAGHAVGLSVIDSDGRWRAGEDVGDADNPALAARAALIVAWMGSTQRDPSMYSQREVLLG